MSIQQTKPGALLAAYPEYGLTCRYDDEDDPEEVTVFEGRDVGDTTTEWLTVSVDVAVPLEDVR